MDTGLQEDRDTQVFTVKRLNSNSMGNFLAAIHQ